MKAGGRDIRSGAYCGVVRPSSCLGIDSGVRDFRRGTGAWNMVQGFTTISRHGRFVSFVKKIELNR